MMEPDYSRSVHLIPHTILRSFLPHERGIDGIGKIEGDRIILVLVDALGLNLYSKYWKDFGYLISLSSVFPSTTAAAVTSIFTGLTPKEHGLLEWYMYYEDYGDVIKSIPFAPMDSDKNDALLDMGYNPKSLFGLETMFTKLKSNGVQAGAYIKKEYTESSYSRCMLRDSELRGYSSFEELEKLIKSDEHQFIYVYIDDLDITQHAYGPDAEETERVLKRIKVFFERIRVRGTTILVAADHGQTKIERKRIVTPPCTVGGSPRDMFVYCDFDSEFSQLTLRRKEILRLLGPGMEHEKLKERMPEEILLPPEHETMWFREFEVKGLHGGLSADEMQVPLIILEQ